MTRDTNDLAPRLARALGELDFNRSAVHAADRGHFKQWVHVAIAAPKVTLVANFSVVSEPAGPALRVVTMVRTDRLRGHVRRVAQTEAGFPPGREVARFGDDALVTRGDVHELTLHEPALGLRAELTLQAMTSTSVLHHRSTGSGQGFHWAVTPRLQASGVIELDGERIAVDRAPAYRDRNWGSFRFGDLAWDWGQLSAPADGPPCAIVFARMMNAARTRVNEQHVLVWWGRGILGSFRDRQIAFSSSESYRGALLTIPPVLALCRPGHANPVPQVVTVEARSSRGELSIRFDREVTARVMVPNDARLGTTAIHESFGKVSATGNLDGQPIAVVGQGIFEFVHA